MVAFLLLVAKTMLLFALINIFEPHVLAFVNRWFIMVEYEKLWIRGFPWGSVKVSKIKSCIHYKSNNMNSVDMLIVLVRNKIWYRLPMISGVQPVSGCNQYILFSHLTKMVLWLLKTFATEETMRISHFIGYQYLEEVNFHPAGREWEQIISELFPFR